MWSSIANLKENLNKIALDVHDDDDDEELSIHSSRDREVYPDSDRRNSHSFSHSRSPTPIANGFDSPSNFEVFLLLELLLIYYFFLSSIFICFVRIFVLFHNSAFFSK